MEMASPSSSHVEEDDFDWEAAVREIDSACETTIPSTSYGGTSSAIAGGAFPRPALPLCRARQSTLDRFVNTKEKQKPDDKFCTESDFQVPEAGDIWVRNNPSKPGDGAPAVSIDPEAAKNWIYPVNVPLRDYQFTIAKTALFSNTLVALPTGLGKTLIAAVVMYNYFRWFPQGKIVFAAPSRPLVMQQIEACHNIVGIPQEWTIDMTGQMSPPKRSRFWKAKRVFFLTPQVFEKDIHSGICLVRQLVCLVFDEAHRATGNYSYCVVVRELMAIPMQLRILALTATPGSKHQTIQNVIDNLCISTLEYRNESDHDVNSYMHNRKLELIEVPMGEDAAGINSMLLQVIQPFVARLTNIGALPHRDFSTLSPSELLNLRDKFRQAPQPPYPKFGEIEAYFSVLITFYHIRKLLSSHGIRPAYEMIQDKLNQGFFSKLVSKIEDFWKAKNLMQQSLSHGVPSPKVVKMLEILIDHFKTKDPNNSRVIIFSNFRGSVRDIMSYLSSIGDIVRATEFVGQSSGKTLKGQTQKVQQAVLEKFRSGGYNVIVATSIGEEGLDIMEVDLVICFDANVSPLRMIQRMGRTGRKNDGRVVVLACEGSELKSYLKKQATSKAMKKHMHNGGVKNFNFHCSPRMVPHIFKPQVQYLEMPIEQFVHRGKKAKNSNMDRSPFLTTISTEERNIIAKYFPQTTDITWKPSLIAFPRFQVLPSQVSRVRHSFKTASMFIDAMQDLQGLSLSKENNDDFIEVDASSQSHNELNASFDNIRQGSADRCTTYDVGGSAFQVSPSQTLEVDVVLEDPHDVQKPKPHCLLFSKDYVTVSSLGSVLIAYVPAIQHRGSKKFQVFSTVTRSLYPEGPKPNHTSSLCSLMESEIPTIHVENPKIKASSDLKETCNGPPSCLITQAIQNDQQSKKHVYKSPGCEQNHQDFEKSTNAAADIELSPRLTHFIEDGIVPESPVMNVNLFRPQNDENILFPTRLLEETSTHEKKITGVKNTTIDANEKNVISPVNEAVHTPNTMNQRSSDDWKCSSGEASNSFFKDHKYKRLCKQGDIGRKLPIKTLEKKFELVEAACGSSFRAHESKLYFRNGEKEKSIKHVDAFIEEEAEVSSDASVSEDEVVDEKNDQYDDSFIDDRINPTEGSTEAENSGIDMTAFYRVSSDASVSEDEVVDEKNDQYDDSFIDDRINPTEGSTEAENSGIDMTAFYRRSLLTQSPILLQGKYLATSGESLSSGTAGSCSPDKRRNLTATPQCFIQSSNQLDHQNSAIGNAASGTAASGEASRPERCSEKLESRKRKLIFRPSATIPEEIPPEKSGSAPDHQVKVAPSDTYLSCDDDFYQGIDLDEVEAQATKLLRYQSDLSFRESADVIHDRAAVQIDEGTGIDFICSPLFDLGI